MLRSSLTVSHWNSAKHECEDSLVQVALTFVLCRNNLESELNRNKHR